MDAHSDTAVTETVDPSADLPSAEDQSEFGTSLEKAFAALDVASLDLPDEPTPKTADKPAQKAAAAPEKAAAASEAAAAADESADAIEDLDAEIGDDWTPKAANRFKQIKSELKEYKSEVEQLRQAKQEYEAKIEELRGVAESKDVETLQEKLQRYEEQQMFADLEKTEAYQKTVTEPLNALLKSADELADKYNIKADELVDIMSLTDESAQEEQISELLPNASDRDKAKIYRMIEELQPIRQRRAEMFEHKDQALAEAKQLEEQRKLQEAADRAHLRQNVTRNVVERVKQKLPFLSTIEGLDLEALQKSAAEADPSVLHPVDHAYNAVSSKILPPLVREYLSARKEIDALTDRLAEYESAEPSMAGASKQDSLKGSASEGSFADALNSRLAQAL